MDRQEVGPLPMFSCARLIAIIGVLFGPGGAAAVGVLNGPVEINPAVLDEVVPFGDHGVYVVCRERRGRDATGHHRPAQRVRRFVHEKQEVVELSAAAVVAEMVGCYTAKVRDEWGDTFNHLYPEVGRRGGASRRPYIRPSLVGL
jgi:hypothetical protein